MQRYPAYYIFTLPTKGRPALFICLETQDVAHNVFATIVAFFLCKYRQKYL